MGVAAAVAVVGKVDKLGTTHPYGETHLEYTEHLSITAFNSFLAGGHFCHLLITFANSLGPDKDRQNVSPYLDPNLLTL